MVGYTICIQHLPSVLADKSLEIAEKLIKVTSIMILMLRFIMYSFQNFAVECCCLPDVCYGQYYLCGVTETSLYCTSSKCSYLNFRDLSSP